MEKRRRQEEKVGKEEDGEGEWEGMRRKMRVEVRGVAGRNSAGVVQSQATVSGGADRPSSSPPLFPPHPSFTPLTETTTIVPIPRAPAASGCGPRQVPARYSQHEWWLLLLLGIGTARSRRSRPIFSILSENLVGKFRRSRVLNTRFWCVR